MAQWKGLLSLQGQGVKFTKAAQVPGLCHGSSQRRPCPLGHRPSGGEGAHLPKAAKIPECSYLRLRNLGGPRAGLSPILGRLVRVTGETWRPSERGRLPWGRTSASRGPPPCLPGLSTLPSMPRPRPRHVWHTPCHAGRTGRPPSPLPASASVCPYFHGCPPRLILIANTASTGHLWATFLSQVPSAGHATLG